LKVEELSDDASTSVIEFNCSKVAGINIYVADRHFQEVVMVETQLGQEEALAARPPLPPFTRETAIQKVRLAEDGWNSRDPEKVALAYTPDSRWRNRAEFASGRREIVSFLTRKWSRELEYRLIKELWAFDGNRIAVRFAYEWHDDSRNWFRSYGNENWEFEANGLMRLRFACINDLPIKEADRKFHWPLGRRPDDHPGLSDLGL
jgi:nuclear transport factor 2 (NTF2) superfamily protein